MPPDKKKNTSAKTKNSQVQNEYISSQNNLANEDTEWDDPAKDNPDAFVNQLGVVNLKEILFDKDGKLFSAAGRQSPVAEITSQGVVLYPPQKPFDEQGSTETITINIDEHGIVLDELGKQRKISGAKFQGHELYWLGETMPGTVKHYAGWFDEQGKAHKLYLQNHALTTDIVFKIRNRTHDGEISFFPEIETD